MSQRPRRSVLYMPAANARAMEKAKGLDCDGIILDLEDAVAPDAKPAARQAACDAVRGGGYGHREVVVRVNAMGTQWHDEDMAAVCQAGPDAIAVPKVSSAGQVHELVARMDEHGAGASTSLWAMLETPRAIIDADAICGASERLEVVVMGTNDLLAELRARPAQDRGPLSLALSAALCAARANQKVILDGVFNDIHDAEGFERECVAGRDLGFDGKTLIHPRQVGIANQLWAPTSGDVEEARELIATFDAAIARGEGVVTFHGKMIENLHVETARRTLALHEAIIGR
ncbi:HpcH/HpaI aldolase/citrate lyase family protein [Propionibacterium sp.]|uniref:HpcH/HpaI aldolase/citrate lyase family protein n=1 Tax=Propionibacterium sp. TaxID=1977903 RepID=UPI0039EC6F9F